MDRWSYSISSRMRESMDESDDFDFKNVIHCHDIISDLELDTKSDNEVLAQTISPSSIVSGKWSFSKTKAKNVRYPFKSIVKFEMESKDPIDYFHLIANDCFYNLIINHTNSHAAELLADDRCHVTQWKDITIDEFKIWLGLVFHTGTIHMNRLVDYWKTDYLFDFAVFSHFMSRDRFFSILKALHFNPNDENNTNKGKIQPLIDFFNERMEAIYTPKKKLSIDEFLVLLRGRLIFRQFLKGKNSKRGIKIYTLGESYSLVLKFIVYDESEDEELRGSNHMQKVVHKLMDGKKGIGHSLFMDNFYNSVSLVENLLNENILFTGTLRKNRKGNPDEVVLKELETGECISQYTKSGICVTKWKDQREVLTISSEFDGEIRQTTDTFGKNCKKPAMMIEFNKFMSGTHFEDQDLILKYYPCRRKTLKWYKKLGIHLLQTMLLNALYLHNTENPKMSFYDFRLSVIRSLLGPPISAVPKMILQNELIHLPSFCDKDMKTGRTKRRRCKYCWQTIKKRKSTLFCCTDCFEKPGFCLEPCFRLFHKY